MDQPTDNTTFDFALPFTYSVCRAYSPAILATAVSKSHVRTNIQPLIRPFVDPLLVR